MNKQAGLSLTDASVVADVLCYLLIPRTHLEAASSLSVPVSVLLCKDSKADLSSNCQTNSNVYEPWVHVQTYTHSLSKPLTDMHVRDLIQHTIIAT